jgi:hypothetical protein
MVHAALPLHVPAKGLCKDSHNNRLPASLIWNLDHWTSPKVVVETASTLSKRVPRDDNLKVLMDFPQGLNDIDLYGPVPLDLGHYKSGPPKDSVNVALSGTLVDDPTTTPSLWVEK